MEDYATRLKSRIEEIERERTDLLIALRVHAKFELEVERATEKRQGEGVSSGSAKETASDKVLKILQAAEDLMSTKEVSEQLGYYRKISKGTAHTCLTRLEKKGLVVRSNYKTGRTCLWRVAATDRVPTTV